MSLHGKSILITGGSQGLGKAIASHCLRAGASVCLFARDAESLESARIELSEGLSAGQKVVARPADVSRPAELNSAFDWAREALGSVDGIVNNAGVYGPKGLTEEVEWEEWEEAFRINLLGTLAGCRWAVAHFRRQGRGKIVNLSGGGATAPLPRISAYACSKAAVVRLTETLAEETRGTGIDINAIAPGALNTRLLDEVLEAGAERVGKDFYQRALRQRDEGGAPLEKGAALAVFLLSSASDGITGRLISALWDPWKSLPSHRAELEKSDVYTLRRIVPEDRGFDWSGS